MLSKAESTSTGPNTNTVSDHQMKAICLPGHIQQPKSNQTEDNKYKINANVYIWDMVIKFNNVTKSENQGRPDKSIQMMETNVQIDKKLCKLDIKKYSFSQGEVNSWNKLPTDYVNATTTLI